MMCSSPCGPVRVCRFAAQLADNRLLRASLAAFAKAGGVVYAECGGLLYLSRSIQPQPDQAAFPMGASSVVASLRGCRCLECPALQLPLASRSACTM